MVGMQHDEGLRGVRSSYLRTLAEGLARSVPSASVQLYVPCRAGYVRATRRGRESLRRYAKRSGVECRSRFARRGSVTGVLSAGERCGEPERDRRLSLT